MNGTDAVPVNAERRRTDGVFATSHVGYEIGMRRELATWPAIVALMVACGPKPIHNNGEGPETPNVADATGRTTVMAVDGPGSPLIVDWKPEQRADLEVAMREGVAVVKYDGETLELLRDCRIDGKYGFVGVTTKTQMVRLEDENEVRANLPLGGAGLIARLEGKLGHATALDVALVIVGKSRTTWISPTKEDLQGQCAGATHFVRGATVGAFVMDAGARSDARTVAQLFSAGAEASYAASKGLRNQDGSLTACNAAQPESESPPNQCAALIRLELNPIAKSGTATTVASRDEKTQKPQTEEAACPKGMVMAEGKCTTSDRGAPYACKIGNAAECSEQCERGNAESCNNLAVMAYHGNNVAKDLAKAAQLAGRACELKSAQGCLNVGVFFYNGSGVPQDRVKSLNAFLLACRQGSGSACFNAGSQFYDGEAVPRDARRAALLNNLACKLGDQAGCISLSVQYMGGDGVPVDGKKALDLNERACNGNEATACGNVGLHYEFGRVVQKDVAKAVSLFERACRIDNANCSRLAIVYQTGYGVQKDEARAKQLWETVCREQQDYYVEPMACSMVNFLYGENRQVNKTNLLRIIPVMKPQCEQGVERACGFLGAAYIGLGDDVVARSYLDRGCKLGDYWACDNLKRMRRGSGKP